MNDILHELHQAYALSINKWDGKPTALYLGSSDWFALAKAAEMDPKTPYHADGDGRPRYQEVPIYLVNADSHLHFSHP